MRNLINLISAISRLIAEVRKAAEVFAHRNRI